MSVIGLQLVRKSFGWDPLLMGEFLAPLPPLLLELSVAVSLCQRLLDECAEGPTRICWHRVVGPWFWFSGLSQGWRTCVSLLYFNIKVHMFKMCNMIWHACAYIVTWPLQPSSCTDPSSHSSSFSLWWRHLNPPANSSIHWSISNQSPSWMLTSSLDSLIPHNCSFTPMLPAH